MRTYSTDRQTFPKPIVAAQMGLYALLVLVFLSNSIAYAQTSAQTTEQTPLETPPSPSLNQAEPALESENSSQQYRNFEDRTLDEQNIKTPSATMVSEREQSIFRKILWYIPNRVIDLVDIVKFDVGIGSSLGAVARISRYGQMGGRLVEPVSMRIGPQGRELPFFFERESEYGFCSSFRQTHARHVTPLELGFGADLGLGFYVGVSFDELADFVLGFFFLDIKHDDLVPIFEY